MVTQAKLKDVCHLQHEFGKLRSNISTYCALLFALFGEGCDLYRSMLHVLQMLSHPFCMQNKQAYTPEVVHRIIWAIIVDTRLFFDDIKLTEDFIDQGHYMQFPASTLEGDLMSIKHGIKLQRHNFTHEWAAPDVQPGPQYYPEKGGGVAAITFSPVSLAALRAHGPSILQLPHQMRHRTTGGLWALLTNAIQRLSQ